MIKTMNRELKRHVHIRKYRLDVTSRRNAGFTLVEAMISMLIMSLLLTGTIELFIASARTTVKTQAEANATIDAARAMHNLIEYAREAHWMALPTEDLPGTFTPMFTGIPGYTAASYYQTTDGTSTIDTGLLLTFPGYKSGASPVTVNLSSGTVALNGASNAEVYDRSQDGPQVLVYRSDTNGVPDPSAGTCLWEYSLSDGGATYNQAIIKSVASAANAVQFVRPTDTSNDPLPFQIEMKIVSGYYSLEVGQQTNEQSNGEHTSQLTGMCVLMRDHEMDGSHEPTVSSIGDVAIGNHWIPD